MTHGTIHAYNGGCRCDKCRERKSKANHRRYIQVYGEPEHGTQRRYRSGCRCAKCRNYKKHENAKRLMNVPMDDETPIKSYGRNRECVCGKKLNVYNPGPLCHACKYKRIPPRIKDLYDLVAESERLNYGR